jgi:hypothetical protein
VIAATNAEPAYEFEATIGMAVLNGPKTEDAEAAAEDEDEATVFETGLAVEAAVEE